MRLTRRRLFVLSAATLTGCAKLEAFTCTGVGGLSVEALTIRDRLAYRDLAPKPELACDLCTQYLPPPSGSGCGGCKVMPGPTHPKGTCKVFARLA